ncbi:hypothetical protein Hanom_Chr16g01481371 [Helianthus anomalus]
MSHLTHTQADEREPSLCITPLLASASPPPPLASPLPYLRNQRYLVGDEGSVDD